jgi:outer membrane protein insertion porin family
MQRSFKYRCIQVLVCILLSGCSGLKHLPPGEKLYTGAEIKVDSRGQAGYKKTRFLRTLAQDAVRPEPNLSIFGMRPSLWLYNTAGEDPVTRIGKRIKNAGEPPVLMSDVKPTLTAGVIDAGLFNVGVFNAYTDFKMVEKKRTAKIIYTLHIHKPYAIGNYSYDLADDALSQVVLAGKEKSLIKPGMDYNLALLKSERIRIDGLLKNKGYFYFHPDHLIFKADTAAENLTVSLKLALKDSLPANALTVYRINRVFIDQDYSLQGGASDNPADTTMYDGFIFRGKALSMQIRPEVITRSVFLRHSEVYSRRNHAVTLNRLMSMGNFKFVQVKFTESDTTVAGFLDVAILLTTLPQRTFRAELDAVTKSNNFSGPRMNLSLLNRNTFRGAELLQISMAGSFEIQLGGKDKNVFSYSLNPQVGLTYPRFIVPFRITMKNSMYIPKTSVTLAYNYMKKVGYFDMQTIQMGYGYRWRINALIEHEFNPVTVSFTSIGHQSAVFAALLAENPFLKKSYEEQFIAGGNYVFTYNEQVLPLKKIQYFFLMLAETSGNTFFLANSVINGIPSSDDPSTVVGAVYSQYAKLSMDGRGYYNFQNRNKVAMRLFAGVAKPYGNSSVLPYSKQYFSGGSNSLRAFQINSVGPGTHHQDDSIKGFLHLGGELKFEWNLEYRFGIYRVFKGALFVDAGNVWLTKSNPSITGSSFRVNEVFNELAVGAGIGCRIDVSFFLLRFDLAVPLRKPWLEEHNRWVTNQIRLGDPAWRKNNLVLNVAIGYPF